jgi:uncharacterized protein (TIGR03067 family)
MKSCKIVTPFLLVVCLVGVADKPGKKPPRDDLKMLQGEWRPVKRLAKGALSPEALKRPRRVVIRGNQIHWGLSAGRRKGRRWLQPFKFRINPKRNPAAIDQEITTTIYTSSGKVQVAREWRKGIYKLEGKRLTICMALDAKDPRPKKFLTKPTPSFGQLVLERVATK